LCRESAERVGSSDIDRVELLQVDDGDRAGGSRAGEKTEQSVDRLWVELPDRPEHDPVLIHGDVDHRFGFRVVASRHLVAPVAILMTCNMVHLGRDCR
jgi:hypothetical protein